MTTMTLGQYVIAVSLLFIGAFFKYVFDSVQRKPKLVVWFPHSFLFEKVESSLNIHTQTYTIQNLGQKPAENIDIIHKIRPDHFKLQPERKFEEFTNSSGEHVIRLDSLGSKEFFSVEILSYRQLPQVLSIRSKDGQVQPIQFLVQQVTPRWKRFIIIYFILMGVGAFGYLIVNLSVILFTILSYRGI